jgi:hypothetical protein
VNAAIDAAFRAAFAKPVAEWADRFGLTLDSLRDYEPFRVGWCAGLAAAANACEAIDGRGSYTDTDLDDAFENGRSTCAEAIRALINQETQK